MRTGLLCTLAIAGNLAAQTLVVDRGVPSGEGVSQPIEREGKGFLGDSFRVGTAGEIWVIDALRVWAVANFSPDCPPKPGDQLDKIALFGALDNPPVPGQPQCACHGLVQVAAAQFEPGNSAPMNRDVQLTAAGGLWQIDFQNLRWSVPGGMDVLFSVRGFARPKAACGAGRAWSLSASAASSGYRLRGFDKGAVPEGFAESQDRPLSINVQVWAHRSGQ